MTGEELYHKYKGRYARTLDNNKGIVVGYDELQVIIAITEGDGWFTLDPGEYIFDKFDNPNGYWLVDEDEINFKFGRG